MQRNFNAGSSPREQLWKRVYHKSRDVYGTIEGFGDNDARLTADAAAAGWYQRDGFFSYRRRRLGGLSRMPQPGGMLELGTFLEVEWVTAAGEIRGMSYQYHDKVPLYWSHSKQALFVLPFLQMGPCNLPPRRTEDALARVWNKGRPALCSRRVTIEPKALPVAMPAVQISYHSDKFTHGSSIPYIHHFGPGVVCYFSHDPFGARRAPDIMIRGGRLRLTEHGIDG